MTRRPKATRRLRAMRRWASALVCACCLILGQGLANGLNPALGYTLAHPLAHPLAPTRSVLAAEPAFAPNSAPNPTELEQQIQRSRQQGDAAAELLAQYRLGSFYAQQGDYAGAIAPYRRAIALAEQLNEPQQLPRILGNLAIAHRVLGQYRQAVEANQRSIALLAQQGNAELQSIALGNLGNVYLDLGDYDLAQESYGQGLKLAQQGGDRPGQTILLNGLGALAAKRGRLDEALRFYNRSLALAQQTADPLSQGASWLNLGDAYRARGQLVQAMDHYQKSLGAARAAQNLRLEAVALGSLGGAYGQRRQFDQEIELLNQSLEIGQRLGDRALLARTLNNLGHAHYRARDYGQAEAALYRALALLDALRHDLGDLDKVSLFDTQRQTYNLLQQVLVTQGRSADALEVAEWGRARALADLLNQRLADSPRGETGEAETGQTWVDLAEAEADATIAPPKITELQRIARDRQATLVEYSLVPEEDFLHQGKQMGIPEAIYIWVVQPDGQVHQRRADLKPLIAQQRPLELLVRAARCFEPAAICRRQIEADMEGQGLGRRGFSFNSDKLEAILNEAPDHEAPDHDAPDNSENATPDPAPTRYPGLQQLHQLLIDPIAELLPQEPNAPVIIVPQGELFLLPFAALQDTAGLFLIQRHMLLTAPSIQTLALTQRAQARLPQTPVQGRDWLVVGNPTMPAVQLNPNRPAQVLAPLPGAEREAIAVAQTLQTQALIGDQALETVVRDRLPQARGIHLATHGLLSYGAAQRERRLPGALVLAPGAPMAENIWGESPGSWGDGLLTAVEILELRLQAELVVLSACDTGRGELTGDGVVGLARAWMGAGVPSVVVSLWAVSDESTAVLMTAFYDNLSQGLSKAQALRRAILATAQRYPSPRDWAAFTLWGEGL